ncbi:MAG: hypothetical protein QXG97_04345, partial [Nitrososphaerota archaeon]
YLIHRKIFKYNTDGGLIYSVKGQVMPRSCLDGICYEGALLTDECTWSPECQNAETCLKEYYCTGSSSGWTYSWSYFDCSQLGANYICIDGACVPRTGCKVNSECEAGQCCTADPTGPGGETGVCVGEGYISGSYLCDPPGWVDEPAKGNNILETVLSFFSQLFTQR